MRVEHPCYSASVAVHVSAGQLACSEGFLEMAACTYTHMMHMRTGTHLAMARSCVIWHTPHATILEDTYQLKKERHSACFQTTVWNKTSLDCHLLTTPFGVLALYFRLVIHTFSVIVQYLLHTRLRPAALAHDRLITIRNIGALLGRLISSSFSRHFTTDSVHLAHTAHPRHRRRAAISA